ncbi:acyl-CoA thioesterase [Herminiimonas contaminans]|uniref:Acyl-CoA thioesterase II n=1 Tax=Herminiimonas contaminans TaxID=1111140 RepID=A0ABS0EXM2_9BURK|nr:acyl-CoA thioesterase II [Herminiimonas contaminans]MBF8179566.1 acyl-CoA thioesterase II [Herminiimonas contaminans]
MLDTSLYNTEEIVQLLALQQIDTDRYVGQSHFMGSPNVFGGQALGQALYAACSTVPQRRPHSMHALFILPGNHQLPIEYEVERVRDGGTFSTRRVVATQEGRRIFVMSASFQSEEDGLSHQKAAPVMTDPETLPSSVKLWQQRGISTGRAFYPAPVDFRANVADDIFGGERASAVRQVWARAPVELPNDPLVHESLFAYVSDYGLLWTALQPHGIQMGDPRLQIASLDHTIWFHRPIRMDDWLLFAMESPNASGGRGLCFLHVYNQYGVLLATVAQEGLIRLRDDKK